MSINDFIQSADFIFFGTVTSVAPPPGIGSGFFVVSQRVTYAIEGVIEGAPRTGSVDVFHPIVEMTATANTDLGSPGLSTTFFRVGDRFIVIASEVPDPDNPGTTRLETEDPDDSVIKIDSTFNLGGRAPQPSPPPPAPSPIARIFLIAAILLALVSIILGLLSNTAGSLGFGLGGVISAILYLGFLTGKRP